MSDVTPETVTALLARDPTDPVAEWRFLFMAPDIAHAYLAQAETLGRVRALVPPKPEPVWGDHPDGGRLFQGLEGGPEHRSVGDHRAWCFEASEWCYPAAPCAGCWPHIYPADLIEALDDGHE